MQLQHIDLGKLKDAAINMRHGKAAPRSVVIGDADGGMLEVLSGLREGELVVVRGNERLRANQAIAPQSAQSPKEGG